MSSEKRRVVVTGLGAVTPLGGDLPTSWRRLLAGESGAGPLTAFPADGQPVRIACEASEFEPERWLGPEALERLDRVAHFAVAAARMAEADAGLQIAPEADRVGTSIGTAQGGLSSLESSYGELLESGRIQQSWVTAFSPNMAAAAVSLELGTRGPLAAPCTACAASAMAIGDGYDAIRLGRADVMLCGGSEAGISELSLAGFAALRALSRRNEDPGRASRPFDADRDGFVMGEGAAVLVLEEAEHARARGAHVYVELAGYGLSSDAFHITEPDPRGEGGARAIVAALAEAGIAPEEVDYVNAHATSTPVGDELEARALQLALGEEKARATPTSSTKGSTGHCLGAAGAVEAAFTALAVAEDVAPPTINYERPDPRCVLDCVPNESRRVPIDVALSNSLGFGGHNAVLIMRKHLQPAAG
jgi:3-oxoacyl-[acyl-carrier-protein] synthase II